MLDPQLITRIREYLAAELGPRDRTLDTALMAEQRAAAAAGTLNGGGMIARYSNAGRDELAVRAALIWAVIRRSHASLQGAFTDGMLEDLRQQIAEHMTEHANRVADFCMQPVGVGGGDAARAQFRVTVRDEVLKRGRELIARYDVEAQFYVDDLKRPTAAGGQVLNFHGPVGAVQTAPFATANVSLAGADGERLVDALEQLRQAIERNAEGTSEQRAAGTEIVADTIAAVKSERPNAAKIAGLLGGLATTVQTTASLQPAWQAVRAIAAAIGIPLP